MGTAAGLRRHDADNLMQTLFTHDGAPRPSSRGAPEFVEHALDDPVLAVHHHHLAALCILRAFQRGIGGIKGVQFRLFSRHRRGAF